MYDAIIVGARCAGSPLAMLLAREGFKVLLVDRGTFPSDIMSTHYIQPQGVQLLREWGLLDSVLATGCPPLPELARVIAGQETPEDFRETIGPQHFAVCPRRTVLDKVLVDAAVGAGAELREGVTVHDVIRDAAGVVTGVSGRDASGAAFSEAARITVGADGLHSRIARLVGPEEYSRVESLGFGYYSYFSNVPVTRAEFHLRPGTGAAFVFPTNDGKVCLAGMRRESYFDEFRRDIDGAFVAFMNEMGAGLGDLVQAAQRDERWQGAADLPHYFRKPYGPGWALAGDAGLHLDPTLGRGIWKAFSEVSLLAPRLVEGLAGRRPMEEALSQFHLERDEAWIGETRNNLMVAAMIAGVAPPEVHTWQELHRSPEATAAE